MNWERRVQLGAHPIGYPLIRGLAKLGPAVRVPRVGVVVSDAALAREVLNDPETFTKTGPGSSADLWTPVLGPSLLLNMDGAAHQALRAKVGGLFTPRYVTDLCERVLAEPLGRLTNRLREGEPVDLVAAVRELAGAVICTLVGLPVDPRRSAEIYARGAEITAGVRLSRPLARRQIDRAREVLGSLAEPARAAFRAGDTSTVPGRMRELGLTEPEAIGAVGAFVLTGTETLGSYLPRLIALCHDSGWLRRLRADPSRADAVVSEAFRVTVPSPVMLRSVARTGRVGKVAVEPGDRVVISTISCARALGGFDPDRPHPADVRQLWFGAGPHFCIGMPLARKEIDLVLRAVLDAGELVLTDRRVARRVLIPSYATLTGVVRAR